MQVNLMRFLDRFIGIPLCWMTGLMPRRRHTPSPARDWKNVLVIKFFGMGSLLMTTPFLKALQSAAPHARVTYLSFYANRELLERLPHLTTILSIRTSSLATFVKDTITVLLHLRRHKMDTVFDLEFFSKFSTLIGALSGSRIRAGFALPTVWRQRNITHPIRLTNDIHVTSLFLRQLLPFSNTTIIESPPSRVQSKASEQESMKKKLKLQPGRKTVCVNVNAGQTSLERRWAPGNFGNVIKSMKLEEPDLQFVLIGSEKERSYVQEAIDSIDLASDAATNAAGLLSIGELIALFEQSLLLITNDSGPMHVACSAGTPVIALFGPETPQLYGPIGVVQIISKKLACSPCLNVYNAKLFSCPYDAQCMKEISVEEVLQAALSFLKTTDRASSSVA